MSTRTACVYEVRPRKDARGADLISDVFGLVGRFPIVNLRAALMSIRLLIWLLFGVASAVLPLLLAGIVIFNHGQFSSVSDTWSHGELLLVSMTLLMASLGDLIVYETDFPRVKAFVTVISLFLIIVSAVWYMDSFGNVISHQQFKQEFLRSWSPWFFLFSLINATVCIMLPKRVSQ
jgi:hypothetical protein